MRGERIDLPPFGLWAYRSGSGTPVVLVHGLSGSAEWWSRNVDALAAEHEVVAIDLPGFGRSRKFIGGDLPLGFDQMAQLLARFVSEYFRGRPVHLVGHSMGGQIAIHTAAVAPELFRSLVLVSATGVPFAMDPRPHVSSIRPPVRLIRFAPRLVHDFLRGGPTSVALATLRLFLDDTRPLLSRIQGPTLLVWGESDPLVPLHFGEEMEAAISDARLAVIPGSSHIPMWENARDFNDVLLEFLRDAESQAPAAPRSRPIFSWAIRDVANGVAYRQSGSSPRVALIHGLGMSSSYFRRLASELFALGISCVAPDLPGFGFSRELTADVESEPSRLMEWAAAAGLDIHCWVGHSTACFTVAKIDSSSYRVFVSPMWSRFRFPLLRAILSIAADAFREPWPLLAAALNHYWIDGLRRVVRAARQYLRGARDPLPQNGRLVAGRRDPLMDFPLLETAGQRLFLCEGAHGVVMSDPAAVARAIAGALRQS